MTVVRRGLAGGSAARGGGHTRWRLGGGASKARQRRGDEKQGATTMVQRGQVGGFAAGRADSTQRWRGETGNDNGEVGCGHVEMGYDRELGQQKTYA